MTRKLKCNKRLISSLFIAFLCTLSSFAQNVIRGTVSDSNGQPLPGAYVGVKGTTNGRVTDVNGKFSIQAGPKDVLTFNCIGMAAQEIKVGNQQDIQVTLKDDVAALDEGRCCGLWNTKTW